MYSEISHSHWLKLVMRFAISNQRALFQSRFTTLLNIFMITSTLTYHDLSHSNEHYDDPYHRTALSILGTTFVLPKTTGLELSYKQSCGQS